MPSKRDLWLRLKEYQFDHLVPPTFWQQIADAFGGADAPTKAFADKLARKLGWSRPFARRAIAEYRRFIYLGMVSPFSVTPPKIIDQVWHEHQLFTEAYRRFCAEVLGRHFDHTPELVPLDDQTAVFQAQYRDTLERYHREFNQEPPHDIWLTPKFNPDVVKEGIYEPRRKRTSDAFAYGDAPLYTFFDSGAEAMGESGAPTGFDGGESGGAGAGSSWSDASPGGGADGGGSSGGSDGGGGSSCSSGCGGSGCGGGGN